MRSLIKFLRVSGEKILVFWNICAHILNGWPTSLYCACQNVVFLAIVQLKDQIKLTDENKGRICLPDDNYPIPSTMECYVKGWGSTRYGGKQLRHTRVMRVPRKICNLPVSWQNILIKGQTCAGYAEGGKEACTNDSGGSMVCKLNGRDKIYFTFYLRGTLKPMPNITILE